MSFKFGDKLRLKKNFLLSLAEFLDKSLRIYIGKVLLIVVCLASFLIFCISEEDIIKLFIEGSLVICVKKFADSIEYGHIFFGCILSDIWHNSWVCALVNHKANKAKFLLEVSEGSVSEDIEEGSVREWDSFGVYVGEKFELITINNYAIEEKYKIEDIV